MGAAKKDYLADLHDKLALAFTAQVSEDGCPAALLNAARQFLKDNNIECDRDNPTGPVDGLRKELSDMDDAAPEFPN